MTNPNYLSQIERPGKVLPGELLKMYRSRAGLTRQQVAEGLSFSTSRMIRDWEEGSRVPRPHRLQNLIEIYQANHAFIEGQELAEIQHLWLTFKNMFESTSERFETYPVYDVNWVGQLVNQSPNLAPTSLPEPPPPAVPPEAGPAQLPLPHQETEREWPSSFAVLAPLYLRHLTNLPIPPNCFIGRQKELETLSELFGLSRERAALWPRRLITLTGAAGVGKSRLALEAVGRLGLVSRYREGVWRVDVAKLEEPSRLLEAIARVLKLAESFADVAAPHSQARLLSDLQEYMLERPLLLLLDNCEPLIEECAHVCHELLGACPNLQILTTSRERLNIPAENLCPVPPLSLPTGQGHSQARSASTVSRMANEVEARQVKVLASNGRAYPKPTPTLQVEQALRSEAVLLFVERAGAIVSGFTLNVENVQTVAQICQRLDGLPWAIELAAAQLNWLSIRQLNQQLDQSVETLFALLSEGWRNELPHHQTLTALVDWSYQRLNEKEQNLFLRLVLLNGNWTVETAEKVWREAYKTGHNPIQRGEGEEVEATSVPGLVRNLITKSLVVAEKAGWENTDKNGECSLCYRILETIRQFGLKKQRVN